MTHVITSLCLRDNGCIDVCPVECISPGKPVENWPTYYIDPSTCIDCGACIPECPYDAIFREDEVPTAYQAKGDEKFNHVGQTGIYSATDHHGDSIALKTVRALHVGETIDLSDSIRANAAFFQQ